MTVREAPVPSFWISIFAFGNTAPELSLTVPEIVAVVTCAPEMAANARRMPTTHNALNHRMHLPPLWLLQVRSPSPLALEHLWEVPSQDRVNTFIGDDDAFVRNVESNAPRLANDSVRPTELPEGRRIAPPFQAPHPEVTVFRPQFAGAVHTNDHFLLRRVDRKGSLRPDQLGMRAADDPFRLGVALSRAVENQ